VKWTGGEDEKMDIREADTHEVLEAMVEGSYGS
jgi:hypothetical protein